MRVCASGWQGLRIGKLQTVLQEQNHGLLTMPERILPMVNIIAFHFFPLPILILLFLHSLLVDVRLADIMQKRGDNHTLFQSLGFRHDSAEFVQAPFCSRCSSILAISTQSRDFFVWSNPEVPMPYRRRSGNAGTVRFLFPFSLMIIYFSHVGSPTWLFSF